MTTQNKENLWISEEIIPLIGDRKQENAAKQYHQLLHEADLIRDGYLQTGKPAIRRASYRTQLEKNNQALTTLMRTLHNLEPVHSYHPKK